MIPYAIPTLLLSECTIDAPPTVSNLINANLVYPNVNNIWEARFLMVSEAYMEQTGNVIECDQQISSIRSWNLQHLELKYEPSRNTR